MIAATEYPFSLTQGEAFNKQFRWTVDGAIPNFIGATANMQLRRKRTGPVVFELSSENRRIIIGVRAQNSKTMSVAASKSNQSNFGLSLTDLQPYLTVESSGDVNLSPARPTGAFKAPSQLEIYVGGVLVKTGSNFTDILMPNRGQVSARIRDSSHVDNIGFYNVTITTSGFAPVITIDLSSEDTRAIPEGNYVYDLEISKDDVVRKFIKGTIVVMEASV